MQVCGRAPMHSSVCTVKGFRMHALSFSADQLAKRGDLADWYADWSIWLTFQLRIACPLLAAACSLLGLGSLWISAPSPMRIPPLPLAQAACEVARHRCCCYDGVQCAKSLLGSSNQGPLKDPAAAYSCVSVVLACQHNVVHCDCRSAQSSVQQSVQ